jgi:hypothetical protein
MTQQALRFALLLNSLFVALILAMRLLPNDEDNIRAFLMPTEGCAAPCFMGIRPGITSDSVAYDRLQTHGWVLETNQVLGTADTLGQSRDAQFTWRWNGRQPAVLRTPFLEAGEIDVQAGIVRSIKVRTVLPFGVVWLTLGRPGYGFTRPSKIYLGRVANHMAYYPARGLLAQSQIDYPTSPDTFWNAPVDLFITAGAAQSGGYESPCWLRCADLP